MKDVNWKFPLVGGEVEIVLYDVDQGFVKVMLDDIRDEGLRLQRIFNIYDPESELSQLNWRRQTRVSRELLTVLGRALYYCERTNGLYDISKGKQMLERKKGAPLSPIECTYKDIIIADNLVTLAHRDIMIDLGSIAKGYIVDRLLAYIKRLGVESALVDARGDLRVSGNRVEVIGIQDPRDNRRTINPFTLEEMAVATSGDYKQFARTYEESHIIGKSDLCSVTVIAPTTAEADVLATALFVLGSERAKEFLEGIPHAHALLITKDRKEIPLNGFETFLIETALARVRNVAETSITTA